MMNLYLNEQNIVVDQTMVAKTGYGVVEHESDTK